MPGVLVLRFFALQNLISLRAFPILYILIPKSWFFTVYQYCTVLSPLLVYRFATASLNGLREMFESCRFSDLCFFLSSFHGVASSNILFYFLKGYAENISVTSASALLFSVRPLYLTFHSVTNSSTAFSALFQECLFAFDCSALN